MTDETERFQARTWQQTGDPRDGAAYYDTVARRCPLVCPSCGHTESLGDLRVALGGAPPTAVGSLGVLDTCARCGTVWNRHAPARAAEILREEHHVEPESVAIGYGHHGHHVEPESVAIGYGISPPRDPLAEAEATLRVAERVQALGAIGAASAQADRVQSCGVMFFWPRGVGPGPMTELPLPGQSPADKEVLRAWRTRRQVTCTFPAGHDGRHGDQTDDVGLIRSDFRGPREDARCTCSGSWRVGVYMLGGRSTCLACELPVESANTKGRGP